VSRLCRKQRVSTKRAACLLEAFQTRSYACACMDLGIAATMLEHHSSQNSIFTLYIAQISIDSLIPFSKMYVHPSPGVQIIQCLPPPGYRHGCVDVGVPIMWRGPKLLLSHGVPRVCRGGRGLVCGPRSSFYW